MLLLFTQFSVLEKYDVSIYLCSMEFVAKLLFSSLLSLMVLLLFAVVTWVFCCVSMSRLLCTSYKRRYRLSDLSVRIFLRPSLTHRPALSLSGGRLLSTHVIILIQVCDNVWADVSFDLTAFADSSICAVLPHCLLVADRSKWNFICTVTSSSLSSPWKAIRVVGTLIVKLLRSCRLCTVSISFFGGKRFQLLHVSYLSVVVSHCNEYQVFWCFHTFLTRYERFTLIKLMVLCYWSYAPGGERSTYVSLWLPNLFYFVCCLLL